MKNRGIIFLVILLLFVNTVIAADTNIPAINIGGEIKNTNLNPGDIKVNDKTNIEIKINKVVFKKDGTINIKGNEYYVKAGSEFVFDTKGKLSDGTNFIISKSDKYVLNGVKFSIIENTKITIEKGEVVINLPNGAKLETPEITSDEAKETKFKIKSLENKIVLSSGYSFNGKTLVFEVDKDKKSFLYFNDKNSDIDGLKVDNQNEKRIDIDFSGKQSKDFKENYISIDNEKAKIVIGKNSDGAGAKFEFTKDNNFFKNMKDNHKIIIQAGKDDDSRDKKGSGVVEIQNRGNDVPSIKTYGDFKIDNGGLNFETGLNFDGRKEVMIPRIAYKNGKESYPMEIESFDIDGKTRLMNSDTKISVYGINQWESVPTSSKSLAIEEAYKKDPNPYKRPSVSYNTQTPGVVGTAPPIKGFETPPNSGKLQVGSLGKPSTQLDSLSDVRRYRDMLARQRPDLVLDNYETGEAEGTVHEATHGINSYLRNIKGSGTGRDNAFYLFNGDYVILQEPNGVTLTDVSRFVPQNLKYDGSYNLYLVQQARSWNNEPLYVLDEMTAYVNGAIYSASKGGGNTVNVKEFMVYSLALGRAIETKNSGYWQSNNGAQFREFLGYSLTRAANAEAGNRRTSVENVRTAVNSMLNDDLRNFARRTYGEEWTRQNLGF
ncbi:MAG: hypothetical protein Q8N99_04770 [Nanoarchaeota archaeon]|nr:hypothetical protein [Nanoarchaeota archaeon]